jgi:hypothetical protein
VPAFLMMTFELAMLFAVLVPVIGMLVLNGLPRLHHPLFGIARFRRASQDGWFLTVAGEDEAAIRRLLDQSGAVAVEPVPS